ncbi:MAG: hypothetical protein OXC30_04690 [Alphaproteobacteria bacterium]|nr:hypothetical protein [Alphaproteobacteria bacterium]
MKRNDPNVLMQSQVPAVSISAAACDEHTVKYKNKKEKKCNVIILSTVHSIEKNYTALLTNDVF